MCAGQYPNIHEAVDQIGSINNLDLPKVRLTLLEKWLSVRRSQEDPTTTTVDPAEIEKPDDQVQMMLHCSVFRKYLY